MPTVYILIGLPGSGKSTWRSRHIEQNPNDEFVVCSTDDMIEEWGARHGLNYSQAFDKAPMSQFNKDFMKQFRDAVTAGKNVIVDRTNMSAKRRRDFLENLPKGYRKVGVVFTVTDQELERRLKDREATTGKHIPGFVIKNMANSYVAPQPGEFDQVIHINPLPNTAVA